ncbi:MAG: hypothetical protein AAFR04_02340 [Pseudomonadota bacterium]
MSVKPTAKARLAALSTLLTAAALMLAAPATANAADIHTGGKTGAYHTTFCPPLATALNQARYNATCRTSEGTAANLERVFGDPRAIGFGQLDVLALLTGRMKPNPYKILRRDNVRECVFAVTRARDVESYGDIAGFAFRRTFHLPPRKSGSAATFQNLQRIDADGLGQARRVQYADSTDQAIRNALNTPGAVAFFVQFPDPKNARFKLIEKLGGTLIPVIDRRILRQELNGEKVYFAQETQVSNRGWLKKARKVVTACTPLVVFTGANDRVVGREGRRIHADLIRTVEALPADALIQKRGLFSRIWQRTKTLSASAADRMAQIAEDARERARPMMEEAREKARRGVEIMIDKARPKN